MDGDWVEVTRIHFPQSSHNGILNPSPVTTMMFDVNQNLLWTGNSYGRVTSFYGDDLQRYTSLKAHPTGQVHQVLVNDKGVVAIGSSYIHMASRKGPPLWHIESNDMRDLRCMCFTSKAANELLVAGWQDSMFLIDLNKGEVIRQIHTGHHYSILKRSRYICAATTRGAITLLDPGSFEVVKTWHAHSAMINNMDAQHDFIVTCGYSLRGGQSYMLDPFLNVFDMKKMSSTPPIPFPAGAAFVRMHPRMLTTSIVISQQGQMHVLDLVNPNTTNVRQANVVSYLSMFDIAPSGEAIALADGDNQIHLWGSPTKMHFVDYPTPTNFPTPQELPRQSDWTPNTPFNTIGMPYYRDILLSAWPPTISEVGAPPVKFDHQVLDTLTVADFGIYGRNTRGLYRNQAENTRKVEKATSSGIQAPKFLSEKARESAKASPELDSGTDDITLLPNSADASTSEVPKVYRSLEIKYSKFGVEDFDFGFYNKTAYSGLEIHIANSYANPLLQILHYTPLVRNLALRHAATACIDEDCLLCEMGFLSDMLQKAEGSACQATNMLKTLSRQPQAGPLGLLEEDPRDATLAVMLQGLTRFLLDKLVHDFDATPMPGTDQTLQEILATVATSHIRCTKCGNEYPRSGTTCVNELMYPPSVSSLVKLSSRGNRGPRATFSQVLKASIERETSSKGWCSRCQRYQILISRKTIQNIPSVLMLNTAVREVLTREVLTREAEQIHHMWCTPGWLPDEIGVIVDQGQFFCYEGEDLKLHLQRGFHNIKVYSLVGLAANIAGGEGHKPHLVALVDVAHSQPNAPCESQWHLFNDFLVRPVDKGDALRFAAWKMPSVLCYQLKEANNRIDATWKRELDTALLYCDTKPRSSDIASTQVLDTVTEKPIEGTIVGLDTEFVSIRQPEIEVHADGTRETIRPIVYALGRVSVVRGWGKDEGRAFIDDYIIIRDRIVDYLTSYSGITEADLDPNQSNRNLVPLKVAYKKLWLLVNLGCRFLGHGLKMDFRVINIHIPKAQVIDTQDLFYLSTRLRKLSLSFLAHHLLRENIQQQTHDSIEDASTALKLYRKYQEYKDAGILDRILQDIYNTGQKYGFKAPVRKDQKREDARAGTPPLPSDGNAEPSTPSRGTKGGLASAPTLGFGTSSWTPGKGSPMK